MYPLTPNTVYVMKKVLKHPESKERLDRFLNSLQPKEIIELTEKDLSNLVNDKGWSKGYNIRTGNYDRSEPPTFIFNEFSWNNFEFWLKKLKYPNLNRALFLGQDAFTHRGAINHRERNICQAAWEVHSVFGCLHACDYCHVEDFVNIMLNIEELLKKLELWMQKIPNQQLYKYDNLSDIPVFEPEYNACKPFVEFFAKKRHQFLLLYTKSDNIDYLLDLNHNNQTIINWSISPEIQSRLIEKDTPYLDKRIIAMKKCQEAGYTVRARFSPLIPIKNWQEAISEMVQKLFAKVQPDVITLDVIGFMNPKIMMQVIDEKLLDEEALNILHGLVHKKKLYGKHTFPHEYRKKILSYVLDEVKEISPSTPVSICNETNKMWNELSPKFNGMTPNDYVCCCGPDSVPGNKWLNTS